MTINELLHLVSSDNAPGLCVDSRLVKAGDIFVAIKGTVYDGHDFVRQAIDRGAQYIVCQRDRTSIQHRATGLEIISVDDSAEAAATLAQARAGNPASKLINLAVTGTNGKTTTAFLVRSCMNAAGQKCGLIGTIIYDTGSGTSQAHLTTPDCLDIAAAQSQMVTAGARYMVIEASSHALSQNRLATIDFKAAAFTNLGGDHLDYHQSPEEYLAAKTRLFTGLSPGATAVLNRQSPQAGQIASQTKARTLWYAVEDQADITAHIDRMDINETAYTLQYAGQKQTVKTSLLGRHNISNHLAAAGLCLAAGLDLETVAAGLSALKTIPGRLERLHGPGDFTVLIDYAHTDDALMNVLTTLKPFCKGRLIVVFGCGGDRDRSKRPRMARVAEQSADFVIVTSDNPRTENPEDIINDIVAGFEKGLPVRSTEIRNTKIIEPDRKKAIELAINTAGKGDIVLIAGKGHEDYQIIGRQKISFNDGAVAEQCLRNRK